ncbi:DNA internalization-related competence protein ComEC/Rec2 [Halieaceae bacterium IMCC14734]|uniref:DNA internalization-related competence protein ComEC/Rec2 n=1 Tax=Candidatus Litorirhabdus singularis TaxID=2518993 RepID=A0ABT3TGM1_9GAMM|nr:DNA internalization-related competence protein ComEC/Rec2 [Candidatus Litorirhabdus singularis]MCX2981414.1 DNA internalization-related competence protein ComEC/Rec2 [Candidatus Litorirhabdus singularis]
MYSWMIGTVVGGFGVGWWPALPSLTAILAGIALALLGALWAARVRRWQSQVLFVVGLSCGASFSSLWGHQLLHERLPSVLEGTVLALQVRVLEPPQRRELPGPRWRQRFIGEVLSEVCNAERSDCLSAGSRVLLSFYGEQRFTAGERWQLEARLKRPWGLSNPDSFNYQSWLAQHKIAATGSIRSRGLVALASAQPWPNPHQFVRQRILEALENSGLELRVTALLAAITVGQRGAIAHSDWLLLQHLGLNHLVVVSGLHVGMMAALGFWLGLQLGRGLLLLGLLRQASVAGHLGAIFIATSYSALAGFALPTTRALVMLGLIQAGWLLRRRFGWRYSISWALLLVMLMQPLATHNAGFWMSFGAVLAIAGLLLLRPDIRGWRQLLYLQLCLSTVTGLLSSLWFGGSSWAAPVANLVAIPVVGLLVAPLGLAGVALLPVLPGGAVVCWQIAALPLRGLLWLGEWLKEGAIQPWLAYHPTPASLLLALSALLLCLLPAPLRWRWLAVPLLLPLLVPYRPAVPADTLVVNVLDVGQGLAVVLRTASHTVLYDTGAGDPAGPNMATAVILPYLYAQGIESLDLLVISHADNDHASGLDSVRAALPVQRIWLGDPVAAGMPDQGCGAGATLALGQLRLTQLHPDPLGTYLKRNNRSCVLLVEHGDFRVMLPGDIEQGAELELIGRAQGSLEVDLLIAPHHGSLSSSSGPFVSTLKPSEVVFASGYLNRFGHPRPEVAARYRRRGARLWNTAQQGALEFKVREGRLQHAAGWREQQRYYWH